ncbi:hypothetical protein H5410_057062 [Solanum commersonii]|uniref:Uncharacterized protein n=1 Tax=Solanum commersonii TaxID=4109 RepID=A0A9J5WPJ3_SOLCO|nr:hypothetical protein H5410_057062 [Solanum commersonii]
MGLIESTVAYDPVYFNTQPNLELSLCDVNIIDALTLNVKTHGYNYVPGPRSPPEDLLSGKKLIRYLWNIFQGFDIISILLGDGSKSILMLLSSQVDVPQNLDLLNKWTIPKFLIKSIYDYGWFDKLSSKQLIKTTEQSLALNLSEQTIPIRDARKLNFRQSLVGSIESTVAYGPVYFNTQPNLQLSLSDVNILDALTLNVKTNGYNYVSGSELISLSYRIYFKSLSTLNPRCKLYDTSDQTILVETKFTRSKVTTRRPIKWKEIDFPPTWTLNLVISPNQLTDAITNSNYSHISQNPDGRICIQFFDNSYALYRQSFSNNKLMSFVNHSYNRHSLSSHRLLPTIHHISHIEPIYGPARDRAASLHTIATDSNSLVEKVLLSRNFKNSFEEDIDSISIAEINKFITQNNYLSLYVKVLGKHNSSLDKKLDDLTILIKDIKVDIAKTNLAFTSEGKPKVVLTHVQRPPEIQDFKFGSLNDLEELLDKKFSDLDFKDLNDKMISDLKFKPIDLSQDFADKMETTGDYKNQVSLEFNKLGGYRRKNSGYATKLSMNTYYYPSSTHKDVLIEERDCWWDNYLNMEEKASIINVIATDDGVDNLGMTLIRNREDVVYTLVLTILEHFNQHKTIRTLLNGLRCQTLGHFRWYKDTLLGRVMELPKNKFEHWKAKFIDGLPPLFVERVRKALRGSHGEIPYKDYTYGKIIGTFTQEGLNCRTVV